MSSKERLDIILVKKGLFPSREKAKASIMAGEIFVDGLRIDKAGSLIKENANIELKVKSLPYVSRGGLKLEKALKRFDVDVSDKIVLDIGASTGGFTDCLLKNGAFKVYAVDVGYGQLDWNLRNDKRVVNMERINIRYLESLPEKVDLITIDVSFISLSIVIPSALKFLKEDGCLIALIKPQFEAGKGKVGKKGVVKDPDTHIQVINKIIKISSDYGLIIKGITHSPIKGPEGNIEYLIYTCKNNITNININVENIVKNAFEELNK